MIRRIVPSDIAAMIPIFHDIQRESPLGHIPIDEEKLTKFLQSNCERDDMFCLIEFSDADVIDGFFIGYLTEYFFSREKGAWDAIFYVRPQKRGGRTALRLLGEFKTWARLAGAKSLWLGTALGINSVRLRSFYLHLGMTEIGGIYHSDL